MCHVEDGRLIGVTETHNIFKTETGAESREDGNVTPLDVTSLVSMNMWGLTPEFMEILHKGFIEFLENMQPGELKKEYLLPVLIDELLHAGKVQVDVLESKDTWFGVTYQEDKEAVKKAFKDLTEAGV